MTETATASMVLPVGVLPLPRGSLPWQAVQAGVSGLPPLKFWVCRALPRSAEKPAKPVLAALATLA